MKDVPVGEDGLYLRPEVADEAKRHFEANINIRFEENDGSTICALALNTSTTAREAKTEDDRRNLALKVFTEPANPTLRCWQPKVDDKGNVNREDSQRYTATLSEVEHDGGKYERVGGIAITPGEAKWKCNTAPSWTTRGEVPGLGPAPGVEDDLERRLQTNRESCVWNEPVADGFSRGIVYFPYEEKKIS
ncbi:MAG: hypothetical protein M1833_007382 [Piccolia ochrophora]|nr:MAG: hypothetical protein M1833_007382 [Piccolia ochrophora]